MAGLSMVGRGNAADIVDRLTNGVQNSGMSCELVESVTHTLGQGSATVLVFEKYYWRANNRASLTVSVVGENGVVYVDAIGSGGGQGVIFKMSWGAEENFERVVENILVPLGFR